jgi:uncharacterized protein (DUF433 family)
MNAPPIPIARQHISSTPDVCGGKPCIAATRIRVQDIYVWHELQGQSPDEIVHDFPQITLADVYAALSYFWDNRAGILQQMQHDQRFAEQMKQKSPSLLPQKLKALKANGDSISS